MSKTTQENKKKALKLKEQQPVEVSESVETHKAVTEAVAPTAPAETEVSPAPETHKTKSAKVRSKRYQAVKKKIDVAKYYPLTEAVKLVQETSLSKFDGKVEAHITVTDIGNVGEISFPHLQTASKKIVVLNDTILAQIKDGQIDFDILIATPATMPKLLPFAKTLGPKGLMPNPKTGTLTDDPDTAVKRLSVAKLMIKTEKKAPVVHLVVGKVSQPVNELTANISELIKVVGANKIKKLALCATMGPCVKVEVGK
ncbi:MAG: 50S ribosomal protein L1 [Microgenomates group bacterium ADurb.Bin238]|nr:MAG: 50S ribosomal protein L1 [Microgenomates group bacterium ADurb.Bin238]HNZ84559.1 hypothetical protein [Candidatus Woesebacteria bacterium]